MIEDDGQSIPGFRLGRIVSSVSREAKGTEFRNSVWGLRGQDLAAGIQRLNFSCRRCQERKEKSMCGRLEDSHHGAKTNLLCEKILLKPGIPISVTNSPCPRCLQNHETSTSDTHALCPELHTTRMSTRYAQLSSYYCTLTAYTLLIVSTNESFTITFTSRLPVGLAAGPLWNQRTGRLGTRQGDKTWMDRKTGDFEVVSICSDHILTYYPAQIFNILPNMWCYFIGNIHYLACGGHYKRQRISLTAKVRLWALQQPREMPGNHH